MSPKYRNKKTVIDEYSFDSQKEARRYLVLKDMKAKREIRDFSLQPKYTLLDGYHKCLSCPSISTVGKGRNLRCGQCGGKMRKVSPITYTGDFLIHHNDGRVVVEDIKGVETIQFRIKRKLFEYRYLDLILDIRK